jgi:replicative DNA helicase
MPQSHPRHADLTPPHSVDAERAVLGALLISGDPTVVRQVCDRLREDHFYFMKHGLVYRAIREAFTNGHVPDAVTVLAFLRSHTDPEYPLAEGGRTIADALAHFTQYDGCIDRLDQYVDILIELAIRRKLIACGAEIQVLGYQAADTPVRTVVQHARQIIDTLVGEVPQPDALQHIGHIAGELVDQFDHHHDAAQVLPSGFVDLDQLLTGWYPGQLGIVAARPGVGKTAFLLSQVLTMARSGVATAFFSLEMPRIEIVQRLLAMETGIPLRDIRTYGSRSQLRSSPSPACRPSLDALLNGLARLSDYPIFIDDSPTMTPSMMGERVRRCATPIHCVFVDYLQLLSATEGSRPHAPQRRVDEVTAISRGLKVVARSLAIPVVAASQLSRAPEQRESAVPRLSDLRDSGSIEQDADVVIFLSRDELYQPTTDRKGIATVTVAKHRNGPIGTVYLQYDASTTRFQDLPRYQTDPVNATTNGR